MVLARQAGWRGLSLYVGALANALCEDRVNTLSPKPQTTVGGSAGRLVLAIDPGDKESGFVLFDGKRALWFGKVPNTQILADFAHYSSHYDKEPDLVIEMIASYGMPVGKEVFETCVWIGRFMQAWGQRSPIDRLTRNQVKNHVCHSSRAKDSNIRQALIDRFGQPGTKNNPGPTYGVTGDIWAALAVAVTYWDLKVAA